MPPFRKRGPALSLNHFKQPSSLLSTSSNKRRIGISPLTMASSSNAFSMLNEMDLSESESLVEEESSRRTIAASVQKSSPQKPPPLNITGVEYATVNNWIKALNPRAGDYSISLAPFGIRVYSANIDRYKVLKNELEKLKAKFFTYQLREEQTTKIVLHGLYSMPENELQKYLEEVNVKPTKIKKMNIQQKKYSDHCLYLLYFLKSEKVKISKLREIPAINSVKVRWQYYAHNRNGPMQCSNCMLLGHGSQNCRLDPKCMRCSGPHNTQTCPRLIDPITKLPRDRIPEDQVKCALCHQCHTANYSRCEKRLEFIERQQRYRNRTQRQPQRQPQTQRTFVNAPQLNNFNFPHLDPRERATRATQNAQWVQNPHQNDLFSSAELMPIFEELMSELSRARSRMEQITALGRVAIKYCGR